MKKCPLCNKVNIEEDRDQCAECSNDLYFKRKRYMEQQNIKWHYDKKFKQWYALETIAYANDGFTINKYEIFYKLKVDAENTRFYFSKLKSAKQVANLLRHG